MRRTIVLDTNCLIQILSKRSPYRNVWEAFLNKDFDLAVTTDILLEYTEILSRLTTSQIAKNVVDIIRRSSNTIFCNVYYDFKLIEEDDDDNKFVDCAIASQAEYIVSNDHHFEILKTIEFPKIIVESLKNFSERLKKEHKKTKE